MLKFVQHAIDAAYDAQTEITTDMPLLKARKGPKPKPVIDWSTITLSRARLNQLVLTTIKNYNDSVTVSKRGDELCNSDQKLSKTVKSA